MNFNFSEEVICGHSVSSSDKKVWYVEMDLAKELLRVCNKYHLGIWATGGTLIGAVRHHGFIPWDDDMDFCMFRSDYDKLMEIGPTEFKYPYFFQSFHTDTFWPGMVKLRRSDTAMIEEGYQGINSMNRGIFIDIFVMDGVPEDLSKIKFRYSILKSLNTLLYNFRVSNNSKRSLLTRIKHFVFRMGVRIIGPENLYRIIDKQTSRFRVSECDNVAFLGFYLGERYNLSKFKLRKKYYYDETVLLPFHDMMVPAPKEYDKLLTDLFGDYMTPKKIKAEHSNLIIDCDRSYLEVLKDLNNNK